MTTSKPLASAAIAFTVLAWASAFPLIRVGLQELGPLPLASARFAVAGVLVAGWLAWKRPTLPSRRDLLRFVVCGLVGVALYNAFLNAGQQTVSAGAASFIINTSPIITAAIASTLLREHFDRWRWLGSAVSFAGVSIIAVTQPGQLSFGAGTSLVLVASFCQATYFLVQRPLVDRYGALTCTAYTLLVGALFLCPWLPSAAARLAAPGISGSAIAAVLALGILPGVLGYATWTYALGGFGAARAANFLYLVPPVANVLAFLLAGEIPGTVTLGGGAIALAGVLMVNARRVSRRGNSVQTSAAESPRPGPVRLP